MLLCYDENRENDFIRIFTNLDRLVGCRYPHANNRLQNETCTGLVGSVPKDKELVYN